MSERNQVNIRLDHDLLAEIDRLAQEEAIDRSEMARRLLDTGLATRRMQRALEEYRSGNVTAWRAAGIAGVSLYEMVDRIHEAGIPHELDQEALERVGAAMGAQRAIHEEAATYGRSTSSRGGQADGESGIAELREQFRPARVRVLFVGESSPAGSTHFYRANSNLFRAIRAAFARAYGEDAVPDGPRFLHEFRDRGCWLVDLDHPVNRLSAGKRQALVSAGEATLAETIEDAGPEHLVAVKATIDDEVRSAATIAGSDADLLALPFPVRQWRSLFVRELAEALRRWATGDA